MPEEDVANIFSQIAYGVEHMQNMGVMHRDLKLGNILISNETKKIKIIDFGCKMLGVSDQGNPTS